MQRDTEELLRDELRAARIRREAAQAVAEGEWQVAYRVALAFPIVMAVAVGGAILVTTLLLPGCHDGCEPEDDRCAGAMVQVCASDGDWQRVADCAEVEPGAWECCEDVALWGGGVAAACVPAGECEVDAGGDE
jgi:hypothetical protein